MKLTKHLMAIMGVVLLGIALSGCGSDDDDNPNPNPNPNPSPSTNDPWLVSQWFTEGGQNNRTDVDPMLKANGMPSDDSPVLQGAEYLFSLASPDLQDAAFAFSSAGFTTTDYIGAFPQDSDDNWTKGWTVDLNGNTTVWEPASGGTLNGATPAADGACPAGTNDIGDQAIPAALGGGSMDICELARDQLTDLTLTNDNVYETQQGFPGTYIGNGQAADGNSGNDVNVTLTMEPGTLIIGDDQEALVITRGSKVEALGTAEDPIVMTSRTHIDAWFAGGDGTSGRGEWAGFALMGYARSNECGTPCDVAAEGNIGAYGGTNDADNSGTVQYVVIRHAGNDIDGNGNELNGFTLFGVGSGTSIDHIQVHNGFDDGVEHFGSTDFMSHIVITGAGDDSFDWGQGYRGGAQFIVIKQAADQADHGIEADNDEGDADAEPVSQPTLANMTLMGDPNGSADANGILLRRGTGAVIWNSIVTGFADSCIDLDDAGTFERAGPNAPSVLTGDLVMNNSVVSCTTNFDEE